MRSGIFHIILMYFIFATPSFAEGDIGSSLMAVGMAAATAGAAAAQASADKAVAKINANAQVKMTEISSDTSKYLSDNQKDISFFNTLMAQQIQNDNNAAQEKNLQSMIDFKKWSRELDAEDRREERKQNYALQLQNLQLERDQMLQEMELKRAQLNFQTQMSSLGTGGSSLTVKRLTSSLRNFTHQNLTGSRNTIQQSLATGSTRGFRKKNDLELFGGEKKGVLSSSLAQNFPRHISRTEREAEGNLPQSTHR